MILPSFHIFCKASISAWLPIYTNLWSIMKFKHDSFVPLKLTVWFLKILGRGKVCSRRDTTDQLESKCSIVRYSVSKFKYLTTWFFNSRQRAFNVLIQQYNDDLNLKNCWLNLSNTKNVFRNHIWWNICIQIRKPQLWSLLCPVNEDCGFGISIAWTLDRGFLLLLNLS